jgi:hypothetical protein
MAEDKGKTKLTDEPVLTIRLTEATDDWMRAARLQARAEKGDKEAAAELARMESEALVPVEDLDE